MEWIDYLRILKNQSGMTTKELSSVSAIPEPTLEKIFSGQTKNPGVNSIQRLVHAMGYTLNDIDPQKQKNASSLSNEALQVARDYSDLDRPGKRVVRVVLDDQAKRVREETKKTANTIKLFPLREYLQTSSAGRGDFNDDSSYEIVDLIKRPPAGTSFIISLNGTSMEPTFHNGDHLFIHSQETLRYGEIGLFAVNGDLYVKEYGPDGLISHNPEYTLFRPFDTDNTRIIGKVLGVCSEDYFQN